MILRRLRAFAGGLGMLGLLALAAALLLTATPHLANQYTDRGLQDWIGSLGYRVNRYKLLAFTLSAALAGLAGGMKSIVFQIATLTDVSWVTSGEALLMGIVGGLQTMLGPVVGAMVVVTMANELSGFAEAVLIVQGAVFVVVVMLFRRGIVGEINAFLARRSRLGNTPPEASSTPPRAPRAGPAASATAREGTP